MRSPLGKLGALSQKINPLVLTQSHHRHATPNQLSQVTAGNNSSDIVSTERRTRVRSTKSDEHSLSIDNLAHNVPEHKIDIGDENADLLGQLVSGKLVPDRKHSGEENSNGSSSRKRTKAEVNATLTVKGFTWGKNSLSLDDIISVSYTDGLRRFTLHSYPLLKQTWIPSTFRKSERRQKDYHFLASSADDALRWVSAFAELQIFVHWIPHPLPSSRMDSEGSLRDFLPGQPIKCKTSPVMLVILNPRSGRGRSSKVYYGKVEPVLKLAGFNLEVVETKSAGHASSLAKNVDISKCHDGIICVGGDGIVNEVLNGLISREDPKEAMTIPIGIIPAGSDNSLVWTVLGQRDPVSAAVSIVKGGLTPTDVFAVEWINTGDLHAGLTVAYYGFVSDVLELSEKYQKRFGPLRYFVAGALKFLCLPKYDYEVEYLPAQQDPNSNISSTGASQGYVTDTGEHNPDCFGKKTSEGLPRASSLSSIDSVLMTPSRMTGDPDGTAASTYASSEPSEFVRGLDAKSKRLSLGRHNLPPDPEEVVHPPLPGAKTPTRPRPRLKLRTDRGWAGVNTTNDCNKSSWGNPDNVEISSTMSDPGPIWDTEPRWDEGPRWDTGPRWDAGPKWDTDPRFDDDNNFEVRESIDEMIVVSSNEVQRKEEEKWVVRKGPFLGVLVCNHPCKTVQNLKSQVLAPKAEHDDNTLDVLIVRGVGRFKLLKFFVLMQFGRHLSLPYVEYAKVKAVKLKPGKNVHQGCGIDGELKPLNGPISTSLLPEQIKLIGKSLGAQHRSSCMLQ